MAYQSYSSHSLCILRASVTYNGVPQTNPGTLQPTRQCIPKVSHSCVYSKSSCGHGPCQVASEAGDILTGNRLGFFRSSWPFTETRRTSRQGYPTHANSCTCACISNQPSTSHPPRLMRLNSQF